MEFLYAAELKKRFTCYGHFYELAFMNGEMAKCRSVLEVVDSSISQEDPSAIALMIPDVVVIMMNPGSSRPKVAGHVDEVLEYPNARNPMKKKLVLTQPDNTQYQVMRVAVSQGWKHIRVLNLSDLRDPKSVNFLQQVSVLSGMMDGHVHRLFCAERAEECARSLKRKTPTPLLLGWGQDLGLLPMVEPCLEKISGEPTCTVASEVHPKLNAHPSPMLQKKKMLWLETIIDQLNESSAKSMG
ncbi:MAG: hypothetical protein V5783_07265 [Pontiella sp.]